MMRSTTALAGLALVLAATPAPAQSVPAGGETLLRLDGSNTVGEVLAPELIKAWATTKLKLGGITVVDGIKAEEREIVAKTAERPDTLRASIRAHGTGTGLDPLIARESDIWMASRAATPAEVAKAEQAGLGRMLEATNEHTIALDGLLVIVHRENQLQRLSIAQLGDIFSGRIKRWSELGGRDAPIDVYSRDGKSGTFDTFSNLVLRGSKLVSTAKLYDASEDLSDEVASDPNAIGFIGLAYQRSAKPLSIATACGLTVPPSAFTVKAGEYPLSRKLFLYTGERVAPPVQAFLAFAQSLDAQEVVANAGFVDFRLAIGDRAYTSARLDNATDALDGGQTAIRPSDVEELESATQGAVRLSTTFRFQPGSDRLDSQALDDVARLAVVMKRPDLAQAKVVLIGFTQSQGDYRLNREISRQRAKAVQAQLEAKGVPVALAVGVGPTAPIACNADEASRALNQRVEVWLQRPAQP